MFGLLIEKNRNHIKYSFRHKLYVIKLEKSLTGRNTISGIFHDFDKILMYFLGIPVKVASNIHRKLSTHHVNNIWGIYNYEMMVLDWESARYTKPDKPLNARDTCITYYCTLKDKIFPIYDKFQI